MVLHFHFLQDHITAATFQYECILIAVIETSCDWEGGVTTGKYFITRHNNTVSVISKRLVQAQKRNTKCLLHHKFNLISPSLCFHTKCCGWILVAQLFPAAEIIVPVCQELHTELVSPLCKSPLCWTSLVCKWYVKLLDQSPSPRKWTSQWSNSPSATLSAGSPFPDRGNRSHRSGQVFKRSAWFYEYTPYLSHAWGEQKAFSPTFGRLPRFRLFPDVPLHAKEVLTWLREMPLPKKHL